MMGRSITRMLASAAAMALAAMPSPAVDALTDWPLAASPARYRNRFPGRARPAGSKLARKARKGRVGLATIR